MQLASVLILAACLQANASTYAQKISISLKNTPLKKVFKAIRERTGYNFIYTSEVLQDAVPVTLHEKNTALKEILDKCFLKQPLSYSINGNIIVVKKKTASKIQINTDTTIQIKGIVKDSLTGNPLSGVTVKMKESTIGTMTDGRGRFSLSVPNGAILGISYLGYNKKSIRVNGSQDLIIRLSAALTGLNQIVVIGYGTQKRADLTGSISSIKPSEIQGTPITSVDQGLVGRASGVQVIQTSGMPGAIASIRIRGTSSLQGGNEPLYVIDGVPVYSGGGYGRTGGKTQLSPLATINPSDIESIEILKDASATAIYGSRAANGVVLITTKSGEKGRDIISFDAYFGTQSIVKKIDLMNGADYAKLVNEAYTNDGLTPPYSQEFMDNIPNHGKGTDWQDEIFRSAPIQNYELSFMGGDKKTSYAASLNYIDQKGIVLGSGMKRYSGRINLDRQMNDKFKIISHLSLSRILSDNVPTDAGGTDGVVTGALNFNPLLGIYENDETKSYTLVNKPGILVPNPVATALEMKRKNNTTRLLGDISGQYDITEGLTAKVLFGIDYFMNKASQYTPSNIYQSGGVASATIADATYTNWLNENTLTYSKTFNQNHSINLLGGITFQKNKGEDLSGSSQGFVNDVLGYNNLGSGSVYNQPGSSTTEWSIMSFLGRINYAFKDKYLFTLSGRYDGSSRFGTNNKFAFFPSGAIAWKASEEEFIKNLNLFSNLKVRTGYGITGNQEIGLYNSLATLGAVTYSFGTDMVTGFNPNKIPNPDLKWERTAQYDAGLDLGVLNNNISLTADYYYKKTTNLIYSVAVPLVSGFGTSLQNIGSIQNQGFEIGLQTNNLNRAFKWTTDFNISFNKNKVLELGGEQYKDVGGGDGHLKTGQVHRLIVGKPIGLFYGYVFDGIFQDNTELDNGPDGPTNYLGGKRYKDLSGPDGNPDGKVDATYDRTVIGDPNPDFYGGLANTFSYKGVELSIFINYSYGNDILNYNAFQLGLPSGGQNVYADLVNRWTPENHSNVYGKATTNRSAIFSNQFIEDGSFIKLKTVTLSYLFPKLSVKWLYGLKVYITGQNLLAITHYKGYDPEVSYRGASNLETGEDFGGYPQARSFLFGISVNLN
ncbi:TonB-dependent receptor [Compostibacter hankyongensis]|uniref:TonB-dependent receptor n=1 Tax=Compostibacter hankyongensis TaxID=1007089 RepID=A0ABP8G1N8_9BACT